MNFVYQLLQIINTSSSEACIQQNDLKCRRCVVLKNMKAMFRAKSSFFALIKFARGSFQTSDRS